jgi:hypothetical protein
MAKVLLTWEMGAGAGHCVKLAPIAQRLALAGHQLSVAARDLTIAQRFFNALPIACYQAPLVTEKPAYRIRGPRTMSQILHNTRFGDDGLLRELVWAWRNLFAAIRPDLVIFDYSPTALLASRWHGHRRVVIGTGFEIPPSVRPLPDIEYWRSDKLDSSDATTKENAVLDRCNKLLCSDRMRPLDQLADLFADVDLSCLLTFAELDHYPDRVDAKYWGAWSPIGGLVPSWPASSVPRVFGYLKPPRTQWDLGGFLSIMRSQQMSTLIYAPGAERGWLERFESPVLRFVHEPVDIRLIASQCDAAILNGNAGGVIQFLLQGVPLLNIPLHLEQLVTAHRVSDLGAGLTAAAPRPQEMFERLNTILNMPRYREASLAFAQQYAGFDPEKAIDELTSTINDLLAAT